MATGVMTARPHTSLGCYSPVQYVDTDTKLASGVTLTPGFRSDLEAFYPKASVQDKARCLELLTSLDIGQTIKDQSKDVPQQLLATQPKSCVEVPRPPQRPKTAMASYNKSNVKVDVMNPYTTSYDFDYQEKDMLPTNADRPRSTRNYHASYELSGPVGISSYQNEFYKKKDSKLSKPPMSKEDNRNNPHPLQSFMVWRLPRNSTTAPKFATNLTDEMMDKVCRGQLTSTYQQDYLGVPQGCNAFIDERLQARDDYKDRVQYTLDSIMRHSYQKPRQQPELKGNNSRYGCNKKKHAPIHGVVPTVSKRNNFLNLKTRTTYEREYNEHAEPQHTDVRDLAKQYGAQSLQRYYTTAKTPEKEAIRSMMETISDGKPMPAPRPPSMNNQYYQTSPRTPSSRQASSRSSGSRLRMMQPPKTSVFDSPSPQAWEPHHTGQIAQHVY